MAEVGLEPYGGDAFALPYAGNGVEFTNLVGVARGREPHLDPILIGAHYDTAGPYPGADDNAAAVAIALAVAERLRTDPADRDVVIALFDAEEPPWFHSQWMGSTRFRERQQGGRMHAVVIMDLVGHAVPIPGAEDVVFVTGMESDPGLGRTIRARPELDELRVVTALNRYVGDMSDHHTYRLSRTPYLFATCGRWEHYHLTSDTPEKLDYGKMAAVAELIEHFARDTATRELSGPWESWDTTETDLELMRDAIGHVASGLGVSLESRRDIDRLAGMLMQRFRV